MKKRGLAMNFEKLPDTWKVVRLGRVAEIVLGKTPHRKDESYWENGIIPWVKIQDMTDKVIYDVSEKISEKAFNEVFHNNLIPKETLIMSFKLTIGKTAFLGIDAVHNEAIVSIFPNPELVDKNYLFYLLPSLNYAELTGGAAKGETLNKGKLQNLSIPLPPLPEQKRIVEILSLAEELISKQKEAIALIDKILMAKFLEMFSDPATNPKRWMMRRLGEDDLIKLESGKRPRGGALKKGNILSIGGEHINDLGRLEIKEPKYISFDFYNRLKQGKLQIGDVIMCKDGAKTGKVAYIHQLPGEHCAVNEHVFIIRSQKEELNNIYLFYFLFSKEGQRKIKEKFHGIIGGIKKDDVYDIQIPLPPIELQKQFAQLVEEFEKKREEMQKTLETLEPFFKLLQKKAFTGELTAEWREQNKLEWEIPKITERQAILLATLYYYQNLVNKPAMLTIAMKSAFLLQKEAGLNLGYNFIPYKYGPFSKEVYEDIEELEKNLIVERIKPRKDIEMTEIKLIDEFEDWSEKIMNTLPQEKSNAIKAYIEKYGKMELNELLNYVYAKYPEYAVKSEKKRKQR